jgi:hypothetical protein
MDIAEIEFDGEAYRQKLQAPEPLEQNPTEQEIE